MNPLKRHAPTVARALLGLVFFVFGLNGFFGFLPQPPPPESAAAFLGGLAASGYMFPLIKGTEVAAGALLLVNRYVPLALTVLAPVIVNIVAFHTLLAPMTPIALLVLALEVYLAFVYRSAFRPVLQARVAPDAAAHGAARELAPAQSAA